jgi:hypothetical protein
MAGPRRTFAGLLAAGASVVLLGLFPSTAAAEDTVAFTIKDPRIVQPSGLARDVAASLYWTTNNAAAGGVAYGITASGVVRGTLNYRARPVDVEALALVNDRLYVADIGDNNRTRSLVTVYLFDSPRASGLTVTYHAYDFAYPDGAHDAETLLVSDTGQIFIVTKAQQAGAIYEAPVSPSRSTVNRLRRVGAAPAQVTDGTFMPDGGDIALRTDKAVYVLAPSTYQITASADLPAKAIGRSLAVGLDGSSLLVGAAGKAAKVYRVPLPTTLQAGSPSPTTSPTAVPSGSGDDTDTGNDTSGQGRRGTLLAIGLAGLVATVAGVVVGVVRRPS